MEIYLNLIHLTDEEWEKLEVLSALEYSNRRIAEYFNLSVDVFDREASNPNSKVATHLRIGREKQDIDERFALYNLAKGSGKEAVSAQKQIFEIKRTKAFKISKLDIIGGFDNDGMLERLMDYVQSGELKDVTVEEQIYIDALRFIKDMDAQYGQRATIKYIIDVLKLKTQRAQEMYSEALNLFYSDNNVTKQALRNKYAAMIESAAIVVRENALTPVDLKIHSEMIMQVAKLRELDKADPEKIPNELYLKPVRVLTLDATKAKLPPINRQILAAEIDLLELPEAIKADLRQDALIEDPNIPAKLDRILANNNE
jgi:hypothetical protein